MGTPEIIRQRRTESGLSQAELATRVGIDKRQIRRYETGEAQPTLPKALAIARVLGISIDELADAAPGAGAASSYAVQNPHDLQADVHDIAAQQHLLSDELHHHTAILTAIAAHLGVPLPAWPVPERD